MAEENEQNKGEVKLRFLTYFLLFFPTILIMVIPSMINGSLALSMSLKILLAFYQFVAMKTFIDKYYE